VDIERGFVFPPAPRFAHPPRVDTITIADLEVHFRVGVPDEERARPQRLLVSVEMRLDFSAAAKDDDLRRTIDYYAVSRRLLALGEGREWKLIERLASDIAALILTEFRPDAVSVEVKKFILPEARHVSVRLTREG
jgi:FolB domain-containing protein